MNWSRSRSDGGGEEASSQDQNHHEDERRWQQERLHREEAYYQFINDLNDEDYRLMRDHNLLGTPGEITSEELQQRLDGVKEQLASQPDLRNGTNTRDSGVPRESSNEDSLLEWLNTFRRTGNATRSGQNGNQTWRAVSRTDPHSGEFRFSLEIHINHESRGFEMDGEDYVGVPLSDVSQDHTTDGPQRSSSPVARRTRSRAAGNLSEQDRDGRGTAYPPLSNSRLVSRITVEEGEESSRSSTAARRHPTITLDLQVRRIRPGESRDWDSIANRTRSRVGLAENTVTLESNSGGFRRAVSRLERSGMRTYVSTVTVPLRRISENELVEPSAVALRSILRQIMTGFGELSSLMEAESESEAQRSGQRRPETHSEVSLLGEAVSQRRGGSSQGRWTREDSPDAPPRAPNRGGRQSRNSSNLVETGTLPILRLAHFLLNEGEEDDRMRGLTKEQIDNLSTRSYEHSSVDSELGKICSVCISDYVSGNKLRQLPCMHEFHIHCIDRWLSENCTCPICRQPVLGSSTANNG
ncbi:E3 ubiquitin-protein ligase RNF6 isoform X3 [Kogia breviceps]